MPADVIVTEHVLKKCVTWRGIKLTGGDATWGLCPPQMAALISKSKVMLTPLPTPPDTQ